MYTGIHRTILLSGRNNSGPHFSESLVLNTRQWYGWLSLKRLGHGGGAAGPRLLLCFLATGDLRHAGDSGFGLGSCKGSRI